MLFLCSDFILYDFIIFIYARAAAGRVGSREINFVILVSIVYYFVSPLSDG